MMKFSIAKSLAVSLAVAAAIAIPTTVKAQSDNLSIFTPEVTASGDQIENELNYCFPVPGYGWRCI